ncbi:MAG: NAD(P)-dependent oxidoreductase [Bacteroidetes bacterium]|nr:NAD(P)-dependent oxidoreductase [Bacteroidota bacterium]
MKLNILNCEPKDYCEEAKQILQRFGDVFEKPLCQSELLAAVGNFDVLIVRLGLRITREVIEASKKLKVIVSATTGLDHIDLQAARERNIEVLSLQGEREFLRSISATAEHTWTLLLGLLRHMPWAFEHVKSNGWERDRYRGNELKGKNLGILGLGRLGEQVAHYGLTFGMKVGAYDPFRNGWVQDVRQFELLEAVLHWSSVLTVHLPLRKDTYGFLNEERLRLLPKGAWIINTARGALIDEFALVKSLENGHLAGAAIDVICNEQIQKEREKSPLLEYSKNNNNLILTPHIGGATHESMKNTEVFMAKKLCHYIETELKIRIFDEES